MLNPDHFAFIWHITKCYSAGEVQVRYFSHKTESRSCIFFLGNSRKYGFSSCQEHVKKEVSGAV